MDRETEDGSGAAEMKIAAKKNQSPSTAAKGLPATAGYERFPQTV